MKLAILFVKDCSYRELILTDYYYQDVLALRVLGYKVLPVFRYRDIPCKYDIMFIWWWSYSLYPIIHSRFLGKPSLVTGTMNISFTKVSESGSVINDVIFAGRNRLKSFTILLSAKLASLNIFVNRTEELLAQKYLKLHNSTFISHCIPAQLPQVFEPSLLYPTLDIPDGACYFVNISWSGMSNLHRKNIFGLIDSFGKHCESNSDTYLILAGMPGDGFDKLKEHIGMSPYSSRIRCLGEISKRLKFSLLRFCTGYVQPSFYEGFGCAVAEAMSVGAPIISSSSGGLKYLCSNVSLTVDPYVHESIASALNLLIANTSLRDDLSRKAYIRANTIFSFNSKVSSFKKTLSRFT